VVEADAAEPTPPDLDEVSGPESDSRPNRAVVGAVAGVVFAALIALLTYGLMNRSDVTGTSGSERPGEPAPAFSLPELDETGTVSLGDYLGQPVVLNFWASWCAPCRVEMPHLVEAFRANHDAGVVFIGIDVQDSLNDARKFVDDFEVPTDDGYILVTDRTGVTTIAYGVSGLPATFFVDAEGVVVERWVGAVNSEILEENIALIRQG
jgi:cytochrome c biogenesis protein CcmG/thiol:disulfide interchange protein DsbE